MATTLSAARPIVSLTQALQQCRLETRQMRGYAELAMTTASETALAPKDFPQWPRPSPGFRTSQTTRQNRFEDGYRKIKTFPRPRSTIKQCTDPIKKITEDQLSVLDPTGARTRLFSPDNAERVRPGDILQVRLKSGEPFSGVCLNIRQIHSKIDWAILLRNNLTRIGVEMWFKVFSPNVEGIEIVQRKAKRARRAKLYYMRQARHDIGSVEGIVRQYNLAKAGQVYVKKGNKKAGKKRK